MMKPYYDSTFLREARDVAFEQLVNEIPWGTFTDARQECFMAETTTDYTYGSGRGVRTYTSILPHPLVATIQDLLNDRREGKTFSQIYDYNVCFLNRYNDAGQHLGWHADDSPGMDHEHPIAVISFGQPREIWWRENGLTGPIPPQQRQLLDSGSLFEMPAGFQRMHQHRIPKGDRTMTTRISLTYRRFVP